MWACLCVFILKEVKLKFSKTANSQYLSIVGCISRAGGAALIRRGLGNGEEMCHSGLVYTSRKMGKQCISNDFDNLHCMSQDSRSVSAVL